LPPRSAGFDAENRLYLFALTLPAAFLAGALSLVAQEAGTITWYAFRVDQRTFGIFDSFGSDEARQAHLQGAVAAALLGRAEELLDGRPEIHPVDILAEKLPA
jgi:quinol monooxygenase YgiN